jgi:hypothetical protein
MRFRGCFRLVSKRGTELGGLRAPGSRAARTKGASRGAKESYQSPQAGPVREPLSAPSRGWCWNCLSVGQAATTSASARGPIGRRPPGRRTSFDETDGPSDTRECRLAPTSSANWRLWIPRARAARQAAPSAHRHVAPFPGHGAVPGHGHPIARKIMANFFSDIRSAFR